MCAGCCCCWRYNVLTQHYNWVVRGGTGRDVMWCEGIGLNEIVPKDGSSYPRMGADLGMAFLPSKILN